MAIREINLVDPGILFSRHLRRHLAFWAGCLAVILMLIGGFYLFQTHAAAAGKRRSGSLQQLHSDLKSKIDEIQRMQAELATLKKRQAVLEKEVIKRPFYQILAQLAEIMNEYTWITQLALDSGQAGGSGLRLKLTGFSASNDHLGNFISRLSNTPGFKGVVLEFAREVEKTPSGPDMNSAGSQIRFQITCEITGG